MLIPINNCGVGVNNNEEVVVSSLTIAEIFEKEHKNVLADIERLHKSILEVKNVQEPNLSLDNSQKSSLGDDTSVFSMPNSSVKITKSTYIKNGRKYPVCILNEEAFILLTMGYTTPKAMIFKLWFIDQFKHMKKQLQNLLDCRAECPQLTEQLQKIATTPFVYSNEFNMINKIVLGMSTKEFRDQHGIKKGQSIRPWLTGTQIDYMKRLQQYDTFLVREGIEYKWRQLKLADYYEELTKK